ncbi:MAG TPA: tRNA (adenosine(37)-N6)-threonylcarbamoyltransferase complex ATPase subunit type 1 TsaE [Clostridia bacterium]|nr:tRNA (adenosine(37)-N6)-threonylcarbamoyltransferase complex ATPase subunit type 1 TsaE [Clostridia bacterium]
MEVVTKNSLETQNLGRLLGQLLQPGDVLVVSGDLGAGKTTFVQGLATGLGIQAPVTSPTFTIIHEYEGPRCPFYHIDAYRLEDPREVEELGLEEYLHGNGIAAVEWAENIAPWLPSDYLCVKINKIPAEPEWRRVAVAAVGNGSYRRLLEELSKRCEY